MKHSLVKACSAFIVSALLVVPASSALAVDVSRTPDVPNKGAETDDRTEVDSIRKQRLIHEQLDLIFENADPLPDDAFRLSILPELTPLTIEGRLKKLESEVPLTYNEQVQQFIERYSSDRYRSHLSRMIGLGQYYFGLYDRVFEETGLPKEIKYLSVVESALDPHAVSRVGATGPWQFMFATAKMYGLEMDSDIDERKDPVAASYAASRYLLEVYQQFGDWLLAIAAYNCGPGNVNRAIRKSGLENPDYWAISRYLPRETRNYVPAFIAMTYMLEYHEEHGIKPIETELAIPTEMVNVQQHVAISSIAKALNTEEALIRALNPAYKRDKIMGAPEDPKRLILPQVDPVYYADLYVVLNQPSLADPTDMLANASSDGTRNQSLAAAKEQSQIYVVKKGDSLSTIAAKHKSATVSKIKAANGLKSDRINPGMKLKIN